MQRVKQYNAQLKMAKEQSSKLRTEIEYSNRELNKLCEELSTELGTQVTPENIQQVYEAEMAKLERNLQTGEEILARIYGNSGVGASTPSMGSVSAPVNSGVTMGETAQPAMGVGVAPGVPINTAPIEPLGGAGVSPITGFDTLGGAENPTVGAVGDIGNLFGNL